MVTLHLLNDKPTHTTSQTSFVTEDNTAPLLKPLDHSLTEVFAELQPFWDFQRKFQRRLTTFGFRIYVRPNDFWRIYKDIRKLTAEDRGRDILSGQTSALTRRLLATVTPDDERHGLPYKVFSGDYSIHEIGTHLVERFPELSFEALAKLHAIRRSDLAFSLKE